MSRKACSRRSSPGYRAVAILMTPLVSAAAVGSGCTSPQTYHRDDGTPYEREEFDAWETVGALLLISLALGALAAAGEDEEY